MASKQPRTVLADPQDRGGNERHGSPLRTFLGGGTDGNERLTTLTGALLIVLLAALGVTILRIHPLLDVHMFLGMLLIGPVTLKMASTGYRFVRYYSANPRYRQDGPPATFLRILAPGVVLSTVAVFASGIALGAVGPSARGVLLPLHKVSFVVWVALTGVHVLAHLPEFARAFLRSGDAGPPRPVILGRTGRALSLAGALVGGVILALLTEPTFSSWLSTQALLHAR